MEGTFDVSVDTPKLHRRGTLALKGENGALVAKLNVGELENIMLEGTYEDKSFAVEGSQEFGDLDVVEYLVKGEIWGNSIDITCETNIGRVTIFGTRLSMSTGDMISSHEYMMRASRAEFAADDDTMYAGRYSDGG